MTEFKTERNFRRAGNNFHAENRLKLQRLIEKFIEDCSGKDEDRIRELYAWYNGKWQDYTKLKNSMTPFTVYGDAFEVACRDGVKILRKANPNNVTFDIGEAFRIFGFFHEKTLLEKIHDRLFRKKQKPSPKMTIVQ